MKDRYEVKGMTCSACVIAVEKAVGGLEGVKEVNVSLLTNSMSVDSGSEVKEEDIIEAVARAGYQAYKKSKRQEVTRSNPRDLIEEELKGLKARLKISIPLMLILMYVAMGEMMGLPYPNILSGANNSGIMVLTQLLIALPIIYVNRSYYISGLKALKNKSPNMDTLVGLGSFAGLLYGIFAFYMISYGLGNQKMDLVHKYMHDIYFESSAMILTLITLGKYFELRSKGKTTDSINKLIESQPDTVLLIRDGREERVPTSSLVVGDLIKLIPGEKVAVDGTVIEGRSSLDKSAITGESIPVEISEGDQVISGSINMTGSFIMRADRVGEDTTINQIIGLMEEASATKAPISRLADKVSGVFVPTVIVLSLLSFAVWMFMGYGFEFAFSIAIGILVISCPCALGLATPVAMMVATGKAADNGIIVKNAEALEEVHKSQVMIFDKTGTITRGRPRVTDIVSFTGKSREEIMTILYALEDKSQQPLAFAIVNLAKEMGIDLAKVSDFESITGQGIKGRIEGNQYYVGNDKLQKKIGVYNSEIIEFANSYSEEGKTPIFLFDENMIIAMIAVADSIKESSPRAIKQLNERGIKTIMLTGDNEKTGAYMAKKSGVREFKAQLMPDDKDRIVSEYKNQGNKVTMVGDGINDAPALMRADVGVAIADGTDIAIDSADLILMKSDLIDIVNLVELSKKTIKNVKENLFWAFIYNVLAIPIAMGVLYIPFGIKLNPMIGALAMSFSSIFVVGNALRLRGFKPIASKEKLVDEGDIGKEVNFSIYEIAGLEREKTSKITSIESTEIKEDEGKTVANEISKGEKNMKNTIKVDGMTCNHCKARVENAVSQVEGVVEAEVSLEDKCVNYESKTDVLDKVKKAIEDAGYKVIE